MSRIRAISARRCSLRYQKPSHKTLGLRIRSHDALLIFIARTSSEIMAIISDIFQSPFVMVTPT